MLNVTIFRRTRHGNQIQQESVNLLYQDSRTSPVNRCSSWLMQMYVSNTLFLEIKFNFQNWCSLVRPKHYIQIILTDVHAPSKYRAMIPLQNRPEFAKAFQCPIGSPMNPERKCQVW